MWGGGPSSPGLGVQHRGGAPPPRSGAEMPGAILLSRNHLPLLRASPWEGEPPLRSVGPEQRGCLSQRLTVTNTEFLGARHHRFH